MKILFLTNNVISEPIIKFLMNQREVSIKKYDQKLNKEFIIQINPQLIISYGYRYLIDKDIVDLCKNRIINLHISLLPWNRGADPNIWSFLENTPKGVTIHFIDEGIDTGDIIFRKEVKIDDNQHSLISSYDLLNKTIQDLFIGNWGNIIHNKIRPFKQEEGGSVHYLKDLGRLRQIVVEKGWDIKIEELIILNKKLKNENTKF